MNISDEELQIILDALAYTTEDLAYRADYEDRLTFGSTEEKEEYKLESDKYSNLENTLRRRSQP